MKITKTKIVVLLIVITSLITILGMQLASLKNKTVRVYNVGGVYYECEFDKNNNIVDCWEVPRP